LLRRGEMVLLWIGILLVSVAGLSILRYSLFQQLPEAPRNIPSRDSQATTALPQWGPKYLLLRLGGHAASVQISGRLEIPRLGLSVLIVDGNEEEGLSVAAVHLAGTSPLGGNGNTVIAAHRDTAFWPLRNVKVGDQLRILVAKHVFRYAASSLQIVEPSDVAVLENVNRPMLTLVTCYPFRYVGNAPKRFVVQAKLIN
ncbi:MAG: class D sortase, partial [Acidobacteriota bacterium]|nr:class D sortase [Acidobacteriota bacterium]